MAFWFQGLTVPGSDDNAGGAKSFGGAQDRSQVSGILESGQNDDQRGLRSGCSSRSAQVHCGGSTRAATGCGVSVTRRRCQDAFRQASPAFRCRGQGQLLDPGAENPSPAKTQWMRRPARMRFFNQVRPFDPDESACLPLGAPQRPPQLLQPRILLTLYNAKRHLEIEPPSVEAILAGLARKGNARQAHQLAPQRALVIASEFTTHSFTG